jgi:hypothetical protein
MFTEQKTVENDFKKLLETVIADMRFIRQIVMKHTKYFSPFIRGSDTKNLIVIINQIIEDADILSDLNLKNCRYDKDCKRKECCAYMHTLDYDQINKPLKYLQDNASRFMENNNYSYSSTMVRNIYFVHNAIWNSLSRRKFGSTQVMANY